MLFVGPGNAFRVWLLEKEGRGGGKVYLWSFARRNGRCGEAQLAQAGQIFCFLVRFNSFRGAEFRDFFFKPIED